MIRNTPYIKIRGDASANIVRAFLATPGQEDTEMGTLNYRIAMECPGAFDAWKSLLTAAMTHILTDCGLTVDSVAEVLPHEKA